MGNTPKSVEHYVPDIKPIKAGEVIKAIENMPNGRAIIVERVDIRWGFTRYMVIKPNGYANENIHVIFVSTPQMKKRKAMWEFWHNKQKWSMACAFTRVRDVIAFIANTDNPDIEIKVRYYEYDPRDRFTK